MFKVVGKTIHLYTPYQYKDLCKSLGGVWSVKFKCWTFSMDCLPQLAQHLGKLDPELVKLAYPWIVKETETQKLIGKVNKPRAHPYLMEHQRVCRDIAALWDRYGFFLETGTGKTALSIAIIQDNPHIKWLVICPKSIIKSAWIEDLKKFAPDVRVRPLSKNFTKGELKGFSAEDSAQVFIVNPESFKPELMLALGVDGLIFDESVKLKNMNAGITKAVLKFSDEMKKVYLLSGCPAPNTELEYFSQMRIVAPGVFGTNLFKFRERYFRPEGYGGYTWKFIEDRRDEFTKLLAKRTIFISKEECLDLPPKTYLVRHVELSRPAMSYYKDMLKKQVLLFEDTVTLAPSKITQLMKLRQITSGFMLDSAGEGLHLHSDKLNELYDVLEDIGESQVIIWCNFKNEIKAIEKMLKDAGKTVVTAYSESDTDESIKAFGSGSAQYIVAHPQTLKYGVTFTNCTYAIYYSLSYSLDDYVQSHDRIYRYGQKKPCTFIFLLAKDTIDEDIYEVLQHKGSVVDMVKELVEKNRG